MNNNNIFGTIGLVNIDVNSKFNSPIITPSTYFIRTINGSKRIKIYYDPDVFNDLIILSASLLIGADEVPFREHYNTVHDEDAGTSGTAWKSLEEIAIPIYPRPKKTLIIGNKKIDVGVIENYHIDSNYDSSNLFIYDWYILGNATFTFNNTNQYLNAGKSVDINFPIIDTITIKLKITNEAGCFRWIIKNVFPGTKTKNILVIRYPYF